MRDRGVSRSSKLGLLATGVSISALWSSGAFAGETTTYVYDALGRLVSVSTPRVPSSSSASTVIGYDAAGNRTSYNVALGSGSPPSPPPPPPPPPSPPNSPPVANPDNAGTMAKCASKIVNVIANDTDPNGDALTVIGASATGDMAASVVSASQVQIDAGTTGGAQSISYTISDGHGGTASSYISVTVQGTCQ